MVETMNQTYYESLAGAPGATPVGITPKTDYRLVPGYERELCTVCGINKRYGDPKQFKLCKWGKKLLNSDHCTYLRFGFMCDKVLNSKGEPLN